METINKLRLNVIAILMMLFCGLMFTGCDNDELVGPIPEERYTFEKKEVTVSASAQEFELAMIDTPPVSIMGVVHPAPSNWKFQQVRRWDNSFTEGDYYKDEDWIYIKPVECKKFTDDCVELEWIKFEKVMTETSPKLKMTLKDNLSDEPRTVRITVTSVNDEWDWSYGQVIVTQEARQEGEPHEMKIRYKGKVYSGMVHNDKEDKIVFEDPSFESWVYEIESRPGVETIVFEEGIVDYIDDADLNDNPELTSLRQAIMESRPVSLRTDLLNTRGNGYRFLKDGALGYCALFDDSAFNDTAEASNLFDLMESYDIQHMSDIGLNDKVSSVVVAYYGADPEACAVLTVWEDGYFNNGDSDRTKHRVSFVATKDTPQIYWRSLKDLKCINSHNSWNDRISSCSFHFGYYDKSLKNY